MSDSTVFIGQSAKREDLFLAMANRHGLVTGATGTGKTVTLQILAEGFCDAGVPVFAADVKGDLSGISMEGEPREALIERADRLEERGELPFIVIDAAERVVEIPLLQFPLWLAFAAGPDELMLEEDLY